MLLPEHRRKKTIGSRRSRRRSRRWRAFRRRPCRRTTRRCSPISTRISSAWSMARTSRSRRSPPRSSLRAPGLREPEKPIGCYLFSGPTGVGKTEVAKQLAVTLGVELIRFDMSEYMERHTVSRLIGAPPGYVGFDQGGLLDRLRRPAPALRAAARRDREGASGPVQHAPADHGPRQADRPQRQAGRLPQRHPDHDDECGRLRPRQGGDRLHALEARGRRRRGDQPAVRSGIPQPARRDRHLQPPRRGDHRQGGGEVRAAARGAARRPRRHDRPVGRGGQVAGRAAATISRWAPGRWRG